MSNTEQPKMRTFKGTITQDFKLIISPDFLISMRVQAKTTVETEIKDSEGRLIAVIPPASPFLRQLDEKHPTNDDAFLEGLIKNTLRTVHRTATQDFIARSAGVGGTLAPAQVTAMACVPDFDGVVNPQVVVPALKFGGEYSADVTAKGHADRVYPTDAVQVD